MNKNKFIIIISCLVAIILGLVIAVTFIPKDNEDETNKHSDEYLKYQEIFDFELSKDKTYYIIKDLKSSHMNDDEITIPNTIDDIPVKKWVDLNEKNFDGFKHIGIINIPANIEYIGTNIDDDGILNGGSLGDSFLTAANSNTLVINVDPSNKVYSSEEGVLYNKDKTILVRYPNGKQALGEITFDYTINSGVLEVYNKAFYCNTGLRSITFSDTVAKIGISSFEGCSNLKNVYFNTNSSLESIGAFAFKNSGIIDVTLPKSLVKINDSSFSYCTSLASIYIAKETREFGKHILTGSNNVTIYTEAENVEYLKTIEAFKNLRIMERK